MYKWLIKSLIFIKNNCINLYLLYTLIKTNIDPGHLMDYIESINNIISWNDHLTKILNDSSEELFNDSVSTMNCWEDKYFWLSMIGLLIVVVISCSITNVPQLPPIVELPSWFSPPKVEPINPFTKDLTILFPYSPGKTLYVGYDIPTNSQIPRFYRPYIKIDVLDNSLIIMTWKDDPCTKSHMLVYNQNFLPDIPRYEELYFKKNITIIE